MIFKKPSLYRQSILFTTYHYCYTVCLAGVFPAIYVSNFETLKVLKGNFGRSKVASGYEMEC
jgi:putative ABC transport system permease protein